MRTGWQSCASRNCRPDDNRISATIRSRSGIDYVRRRTRSSGWRAWQGNGASIRGRAATVVKQRGHAIGSVHGKGGADREGTGWRGIAGKRAICASECGTGAGNHAQSIQKLDVKVVRRIAVVPNIVRPCNGLAGGGGGHGHRIAVGDAAQGCRAIKRNRRHLRHTIGDGIGWVGHTDCRCNGIGKRNVGGIAGACRAHSQA